MAFGHVVDRTGMFIRNNMAVHVNQNFKNNLIDCLSARRDNEQLENIKNIRADAPLISIHSIFAECRTPNMRYINCSNVTNQTFL